jgi:D-amino-acid dehydrogenase
MPDDAIKKIVIIGSGIVGICTAIELIDRGFSVTLIDPNDPGSQTSYGNAGVLTDSSLMIINNPQLLKTLFSLIFKRKTSFRYSKLFVFLRLSWVINFLMFSKKKHMELAAQALRELQVLSLKTHKKLIKKTKSNNNIESPGWLKVFKTQLSYENYCYELDILDKNKAEYTLLNKQEIKKQFPDLQVEYYKGVLFKNSLRVKSPLELSKNYFKHFIKSGGSFYKEICKDIKFINGYWTVYLNKNKKIFDEVVICTGPWSKDFLSNLGYKIPLAWERGYHHHFSTKKNIDLSPAIHDVDGGFVYSCNKNDIRVTSGVELNFRGADLNEEQINEVVQKLKTILPLKNKLTKVPWLGSRPTIADSLPMIGKAPKHKNLWFNFGHNHIGLSTSAGSGVVLADMIENKKTSINIDPFLPDRFIL